VAFGAGLVGAALIPASEKEQQAAIAVMDKAQPLQQQVSDVAKDAAALGCFLSCRGSSFFLLAPR